MNRPEFVRGFGAAEVAADEARWFAFVRDRLALLDGDGTQRLPTGAELRSLGLTLAGGNLLGHCDGVACYTGDLEHDDLPAPIQLVDLRQAHGLLPELDYWIAGFASQVAHWDRTTRFCPACGARVEPHPAERSKRCPECGLLQYPRVSPAIITLIYRPGQVLLTRQASWPANR
jgi:NAD+ diphosphatase